MHAIIHRFNNGVHKSLEQQLQSVGKSLKHVRSWCFFSKVWSLEWDMISWDKKHKSSKAGATSYDKRGMLLMRTEMKGVSYAKGLMEPAVMAASVENIRDEHSYAKDLGSSQVKVLQDHGYWQSETSEGRVRRIPPNPVWQLLVITRDMRTLCLKYEFSMYILSNMTVFILINITLIQKQAGSCMFSVTTLSFGFAFGAWTILVFWL